MKEKEKKMPNSDFFVLRKRKYGSLCRLNA